MVKKRVKRNGEASQLIRSLLAQGKTRNEIVTALSAKGLKASSSMLSYYLYKKSGSGFQGTKSATAKNTVTTTTGFNMTRIVNVLKAPDTVLTNDDKIEILKRAILQG